VTNSINLAALMAVAILFGGFSAAAKIRRIQIYGGGIH